MANVDSAVKYQAKTYRLITSGDKAGLFDKTGLAHRLTVTDQTKSGGLPQMTLASGDDVKLFRTGKPCSCKGAPWSTSSATLREQL